MSIEKDEPAFPFFPENDHGLQPEWGLTKREYAAIQIMAGFAADPATADPEEVL